MKETLFCIDSCFSHLSSATVKFIRNIIAVANDLEKIKCESIYSNVVNCFSSLLRFQYESYDKISKEHPNMVHFLFYSHLIHYSYTFFFHFRKIQWISIKNF